MTNDTPNHDDTDDTADDDQGDGMTDMHDATRAMYEDMADRGGLIGMVAGRMLGLLDRIEAYQSDTDDTDDAKGGMSYIHAYCENCGSMLLDSPERNEPLCPKCDDGQGDD